MGTLMKMLVVATIIGLLSCAPRRCDPKMNLVFRQTTRVMAKPYPQWYKIAQNEVLTTMHTGDILPICRFTPAKDFAVYEVRLPDGRVGYVEYDSARATEVAIDQTRPTAR
jgi:hypothetical protein